MKKILFTATIFAGMLLLVSSGCRSTAQERAAFAQNMNDPSAELTASASGTDNEILVIQLPQATHSDPEKVISDQALTTLRNKGFKGIQIVGSDNKVILEKKLD